MDGNGLDSVSDVVEERRSRLRSSTRNSRNLSDKQESRFGIDEKVVKSRTAKKPVKRLKPEKPLVSVGALSGSSSRRQRSGLVKEKEKKNDDRLIPKLGVPIKKRRFMVHSPSPQELNPKVIDEKDDFYGIEMLAAVCSSVTNDIVEPPVESLPVEESVVHHEDGLTLLTEVEGNDSSAGTERLKDDMEAGESEGAVKSEADEKSESVKDVRFEWDLNVSLDVWGEPCDDAEDVAPPGRDVEGGITEFVAPKEEPVDEVVASPKSEAVACNGQESQSGYDSQYEDGELREAYPWEEAEGDTGEIEQVDYGSDPEDMRFYSMVESNHNKKECDAPRMREGNEGRDIEKHVVVCMNYSRGLKKGSSSPSRSFVSKPYKELPSHDGIQRRRPGNYEELSMGPDKFVRRDDRSGMRMRNRSPGRGYINSWDSKRRFSPPNYKRGSYGFRRPQSNRSMVDDQGTMNGFDQPGPGPDGHISRQFSDGWYRGRLRRFPYGGDRAFRDSNQYPGRMDNPMRRERGNSPVMRRFEYPRSRSRSPGSWNRRNRSPPPPGFRVDERMMERVRSPFPADQEMGFMSRPRNRMSSPRFFERRNNDGVENPNSFRGRKFRPGQRFDVGNSMRRVNPEHNEFRPFVRHRRFESREDKNGGNRFEMVQPRTRWSEATDNDDRGNRFEMVQPRTRWSEATENDGDGNRNREQQHVVVASNNNNESLQ